ncbi:hypothetical protein LMG1866_04581 [Achromobacter ruhlandii]|uniref:P-type conjugative transfer ATPase TrbB n=1 Tax=Achromobacter ruhlandii TaxID=72557 RepID=UPI001467A175|nr:P-type conjugative transfer ATPase TrbB [Achromobacter ruhlandii]CAB3730351.1 hypothetical protein LMG1866_04581 [Achromobacter ruhlandii]
MNAPLNASVADALALDEGLSPEERAKRERLLESVKRNLGSEVLAALRDPMVFEVMLTVNGTVLTDSVNHGLKMLCHGGVPVRIHATAARNMMWTVAQLLDTTVSAEKPILEGEFPLGGERFEGLLPPVVERPIFAMRKLAEKIFTLEHYVRQGIITVAQMEVILDAVRQRKNILVVGGTASGKTTLVNAILQAMAAHTPEHRIIIIEDTRELQCKAPFVEFLRTSRHTSIQDLLRATMRLRPDRIMVGEVRGAEALYLLKAWNTGHPGGMGTIHADGALDGLYRLDELIQEAGVPSKLSLIGRAVDIVLYLEKDPTTPGRRVLKEVLAVDGYDSRNNQFIVKPL